MAEASSVVDFSAHTQHGVKAWLTPDGLSFSLRLTVPGPRRAARALRSAAGLAARALRASIWPLAPLTIAAIASAGAAAGLVARPLVAGAPHALACSAAAVLAAAAAARVALAALLRQQRAFIFSARGPPTLAARSWAFALRALAPPPYDTFAFQPVLPTQPVPALADTVRGFVAAARCVQSADALARTLADADDFLASAGPGLQRLLAVKAFWDTNYVSAFWQRFVYLRGRGSLAVGSNYYGENQLRRFSQNAPASLTNPSSPPFHSSLHPPQRSTQRAFARMRACTRARRTSCAQSRTLPCASTRAP